MWLVAVLWCYVVGCEHCEGCCSSSNLHSAHTLQHNTTEPQPATFNTISKKPHMQYHVVFSPDDGHKMPETCRDSSQ